MMEKHIVRKILLSVIFLLLLSVIFYPVTAYKTESKIFSERLILGRTPHDLYQGYSIRMIEPSSMGNEIILNIRLDGEPEGWNIYLGRDQVYQHITRYNNEDYLVLSITLNSVDLDKWSAEIEVAQYIDPSRPASMFLIIDQEFMLNPGVFYPLKQDYSIRVEKLNSDSAVIGFYLSGIKVKEQEMGTGDRFVYSKKMVDKEHTIVTFEVDMIFKGTSRNGVFIEHLYQLEDPVPSGSDISITVNVNESIFDLLGNKERSFTYTLSGSQYFTSVSIEFDGNIINESEMMPPGTYTQSLGEVPPGNHTIVVTAVSREGVPASGETQFHVRNSPSADITIPEVDYFSGPVVFILTASLVIIWAGIRSWIRGRRN